MGLYPKLEYVGDVYRPSDDTWLLIKVLEARRPRGELCLDLGAGSGVLGIYAILNGICRRVVFVDIVEDAVYSVTVNTTINGVEHSSVVLWSDDFALRENSFDVVLANPPYLPADFHVVDIAVEGGLEGYETAVYFINYAKLVLRPGGKLYLVYSSLTKPEVILEHLERSGFRVDYEVEKRFFYEVIYVVECVKSW